MKSIAFVGAHSSGKSTLINAYVYKHPEMSISVIRGIARSIIQRGFPLAKESNVDSYTNYIRDQLHSEREVRSGQHSILLSDRTVLDAASYAKVNTLLPRPFVPPYFVEMLLEIALLEAARFDLFIYCPVEFPMEADPYRPVDEEYRNKVCAQVKEILDTHAIPYITATGNVETRLVALINAIEALNG